MKHKKKKSFISLAVLVILGGGFLAWFFAGAFSKPVTGQVPDEAYRKGEQAFYRCEKIFNWDRGSLSKLPEQDINMGLDLRAYDVSDLDLSKEKDSLLSVTFDSSTRWPEELPDEFDPAGILEIGKNPGLGIRALHEKGITGMGVNIAIVD